MLGTGGVATSLVIHVDIKIVVHSVRDSAPEQRQESMSVTVRRTIELTEPQRTALRHIAAKHDTSSQAIVSAAVDAAIAAELQADSILCLTVGRAFGLSWEQIEQARSDLDAALLAAQ